MQQKKMGLWIIVSGIILIVLINLSDIIRGKQFELGSAQLLVSFVGFLVILFGGLFAFSKIDFFGFFTKMFGTIKNSIMLGINSLEKVLGHIFSSRFAQNKKSQRFFEFLIIFGFILFSAIYTLGRWNGITPFVFLGSDASYISSYAAALDHPTLFTGDYFLSNQARVSAYVALHIPLIRLLNTLLGSYGNGFIFLLPFTIFFKLFGFYSLGKRLFKKTWLALLLSIVTFPIIYTGAWDYWGLLGDVLPRNLFEIFLPWTILWSIQWIDRPKRWYLLSLIVGVLTYFHSISGIIVFFTITLVYLLMSPLPFFKRIWQILLNGLIYLVTAIPFVLSYALNEKSSRTVSISYVDYLAILYQRFGHNHLDVVSVFINLVKQLAISGILPLAMLAILYLTFSRTVKVKTAYRILLSWILGILLISVVFPIVEKPFDPYLHILAQQMLLIRGIRFIPPLLVVFVFVVFYENYAVMEFRFPHLRNAVFVGLITIVIGLMVTQNQQDPYFGKEVICIGSGHIFCATEQEKNAAGIIQSLDKYTNPNDTVLSIEPLTVKAALSIRYQALRPMGYTDSDLNRMSDDPAMLQEIASKMRPWRALEHADPQTKLASYIELAQSMKANYLIVQLKDFNEESRAALSPVYQNPDYALISIK